MYPGDDHHPECPVGNGDVDVDDITFPVGLQEDDDGEA